MKIVGICGSSASTSVNLKLLNHISSHYLDGNLSIINYLPELPLYSVEKSLIRNDEIIKFKESIKAADAVIISTPEYLKNIPAVLKSALEWTNSSSELGDKSVLPIVYTPAFPRGEQAMEALCWSLRGLNANIPAQLLIHHSEIAFDVNGHVLHNTVDDMLRSAIELLKL